jgi:hypothetical protein
MIDDFEDADGSLLPAGGRQGYWYVFNDGSAGGSQTPPETAVVPEVGGACGTGYAIHSTGSGFTTWGAGIGIDLNNPGGMSAVKMSWDASAYTGIVVMAKGSGAIRANVQIDATVPVAEGGSCAADCDPHGMNFTLTSQWKQFVFPFDQLAQEGWGTPAIWDATTAVGVQFKVGPNVGLDVWIDEIGFY